MPNVNAVRLCAALLPALLVLLGLPNAGATTNTTTSNTTDTSTGIFLLIRVNGVDVNLTNCTWSVAGGLDCPSGLLHDVTVTRERAATGTETWVVAMIVVNSVLLVVVGGVAIGAYFVRHRNAPGSSEYDKVPTQPPGPPPEYANYGYPRGYPGPAPAYNGGPPGYPAQGTYGGAAGSGACKKVIGVALVKPAGDEPI